jgi:hypothetical protein
MMAMGFSTMTALHLPHPIARRGDHVHDVGLHLGQRLLVVVVHGLNAELLPVVLPPFGNEVTRRDHLHVRDVPIHVHMFRRARPAA